MEFHLQRFVSEGGTKGTGLDTDKVKTGTCCAVYIFRSDFNGRIYIGSTGDIRRRKRVHEADLRKGCHHSKAFQILYDTYPDFSFAMILMENKEKAISLEQELFDKYKETGLLLNTSLNAFISGSGHSVSEEHRDKLRKLRTGFKVSSEVVEKHRLRMQEIMRTPEMRERNRQNGIKRFQDPILREKMRQVHKGRKFSEEHKENLRKSKIPFSNKVLVDGKLFDSSQAAARFFKISYNAAINRFQSSTARFKNWNYVSEPAE